MRVGDRRDAQRSPGAGCHPNADRHGAEFRVDEQRAARRGEISHRDQLAFDGCGDDGDQTRSGGMSLARRVHEDHAEVGRRHAGCGENREHRVLRRARAADERLPHRRVLLDEAPAPSGQRLTGKRRGASDEQPHEASASVDVEAGARTGHLVKAFYCDHFVLPLPPSHRFPMAKYRLLRQRIVDEGILAPADLREPPAALWEELALAHSRAYISAVALGTLPADMQRRIGFPWSPAMVERSRRSAGGTLAAARCALDDGTSANLAGGTHHAFADRGEGYCVFNDIAVAARVLLAERSIARPAVVDCDVHQGNGTAAIFESDPAVFTCSIHGAKNFPFKKERSDLDVTLDDGTGDDAYLDALAHALDAVIEGHRPDFVFYIAGADPYAGDRLGRLSLTMEGLRARDAMVFERCHHAGLPVAVAMGGGYAADVDDIVAIHTSTVREAVRRREPAGHARRYDGPEAPEAPAGRPVSARPARRDA